MRASKADGLRPSDVIRLSLKRGGLGRRVVVYQKIIESEVTRVLYRRLVKDGTGTRVSDSGEGLTFLSNRILHPIEGVWEGDLDPGSPGRVVFYDKQRYVPLPDAPEIPESRKGRSTVATKSKSGAKKGAAKSKAKSNGGERATDAQLDKLSAQVVKLRDVQGKSWSDIEEQLDIAPSRLRQLYNRGGGEASGSRASSGTKKSGGAKGGAKSKTAAKGKGKKGKRNPS